MSSPFDCVVDFHKGPVDLRVDRWRCRGCGGYLDE